MTADDNLGPLVVGDEISSELRQRKQKEVYQTLGGASMKLAEEKAILEEANGWHIHKRNKKSIRMAKPKPADEQLEDELWSLLAQMGLREMSKGRNFKLSVGKDVPARQIDVFAKDDETAVILECTQQRRPGPRRMTELIEKLTANREAILTTLRKAYGQRAYLKTKFLIATRNIRWSDADLARCKQAQVAIIREQELAYYSGLVSRLKNAARYQFLGHMFAGQKIEGLSNTVIASRGKMGGQTFYSFMISPDHLLKIAYVGHKAIPDVENLTTYQRMLKPHRLKKIAAFINDGGRFPTNIVLNLKTGQRSRRERPLTFEVVETAGGAAFGRLHLPPVYASAWVIDGQHRLYGYAQARRENGFKEDSSLLPVLAYDNLPAEEEMNLFIDINSKQEKVRTNLLVELYSDLHWNSPDPGEAFQALLSRTASRLNSDPTSPLHDRMIVTGKKKNHLRCLTPTSIRDGLKASKLLGASVGGGFATGPLSTARADDYQGNLTKALWVLSDCLGVWLFRVSCGT